MAEDAHAVAELSAGAPALAEEEHSTLQHGSAEDSAAHVDQGEAPTEVLELPRGETQEQAQSEQHDPHGAHSPADIASSDHVDSAAAAGQAGEGRVAGAPDELAIADQQMDNQHQQQPHQAEAATGEHGTASQAEGLTQLDLSEGQHVPHSAAEDGQQQQPEQQQQTFASSSIHHVLFSSIHSSTAMIVCHCLVPRIGLPLIARIA